MLIRAHDDSDAAPTLDMTPMIDAVFNLLIFFLIATTFQQSEREINIALPFASQGQPIAAALREIVVNVGPDGRAIVNGRALEPDSLGVLIRDAVAVNPQQKVTVRGDRSVAYEHVVRVLDICKRSGVQQPFLDTVLQR